MKAMRIESQEDAINLGYRIRGMIVAIQLLFDPLNDDDFSVDKAFATRMLAEALGDYASVLLDAVDRPSPELIFTQARGSGG